MNVLKELEKASYTQPGLSKKPVIDLDKAIEVVNGFIESLKERRRSEGEDMRVYQYSEKALEVQAKNKMGTYWEARYDKIKFAKGAEMFNSEAQRLHDKGEEVNEERLISWILEKYCRK